MPDRWGPYTSMKQMLDKGPLVIDRAEGVYVYDENGTKYLDGHAGLWLANVGYGRHEIIDAIAQQARKLAWFSSFGGMANRPSLDLAEKLVDVLKPDGMGSVFFSNDGSGAVETALKISRQYWKIRGRGQKVKLIGREHAYHGVTLGALSVAGITANRKMFEPLLEGVRHVPAPYLNHCAFHPGSNVCTEDCIHEVERLILFEDPTTVAAFIAEPVQAAGGVIIPPPDYLRKVRDICKKYDVLFIADEVVTGFGRLGEWTGSRHYGIKPDIMTFAKGITSGYIPLGATAVTPDILEAFLNYEADGPEFRHGNTYSGHPVACAAALATLEIYERDAIFDHVRDVAVYFRDELERVAQDAGSKVTHWASEGLLGRLEVRVPGKPAGAAGARVGQEMLKHGVIVRPVGDVITISPPLVITRSEIDTLFYALQEGLKTVN